MTVKTLVGTAVVIAVSVLLGPLTAAALEPLAVYEDWSQGLIRADRWQGGQTSGLEVKRVIMPDHTLLLRYRREGSTASNAANTSSQQFLNFINPGQVNEVEAVLTVDDLTMTVCAVNNTGTITQARPARLSIARFNDGSSPAPGNRIGDYIGIVQAIRNGSSSDAVGILRINGVIVRCTNASCGTTTVIVSNTLATTVSVGQAFTLRLKWDQTAHQFLFGLDNGADVALSYAPATDTAPAISPFAQVSPSHATANCTAGAVAIDSTARVGTVKTNASAIIP